MIGSQPVLSRSYLPKRGNPSHRYAVNWALALMSAFGALIVVTYAYFQLLNASACISAACRNPGPGEVGFTVITFGAPIVAVVTIGLSFLTAEHRGGIVVPITAWASLIAAFGVLVM